MANYFPASTTSGTTFVSIISMAAGDFVDVFPDVTMLNPEGGSVIDDSSWGNAEIDGVVEGGNAVFFAGSTSDATNVIIGSDATVAAYNSGTALTVAAGAYDITNSGQLVSNQDNIDTSAGDGIHVSGAGTIVNNGTITSAYDGVLNDDSSVTDTSYLYNYGTISGANYAVSDTGSHTEILYNYGDIDGGVIAGSSEFLYNFGSIVGQIWGVELESVSYLVNSGSISDSAYLGGVNSILINSGSISDGVQLGGANSSLVNSGSISGNPTGSGGDATGYGVEFFGADSSLDNSGSISGGVIFIKADSSLVNSGSISTIVSLNGANSSLVNSGSMSGGVVVYGANASLVNSGSISGGVSLGLGNTLDSTLGTIAGGITCSPSGDVVIAGQTGGKVTGGSGNDVLYANPTQTAADNAAQTTLDGAGGNNWLFGDGAYTTFDSGDNFAGTYNQFFGGASQMAGVSGYTNNTLSYATLDDQGEGYESVYVDLLHGDAYMCSIADANGAPAADLTFEDYISNVPKLIGSSGGGDVIICDDGVDRITNGGAGGNDIYAGTGASSQDTFVYTALTDSTLSDYDIIEGFKVGTDKIDLSALNVPLADILLSYGGNGSNTVYVEQNPSAGFNSATDMIISVQASTNTALSYKDIIG